MALKRIAGFLVFLLALGGLAASAYLYDMLRQEQAARASLEKEVAGFAPRLDQFKEAVREVERRLSATVFQEVDLATSGWQPIAGGFYVIDIGAAPSGKGLRVSGKVINPTTVTHDSAQFSVRAGDRRATFALPHVPPDVAQPFEVTLPDTPPSTGRVFFALEGSTISFASSSTRKRGTEPVDTDKLLH